MVQGPQKRIWRSLEEAGAAFGPCALTIGNFDGVHAGHRRILRRVAAVARERGWKASALTFAPHPASIVAPERAPQLLTTPEQRAALMAGEGIGQVLILPFTPEVSRLSPEEFVRDIVVGRLRAQAVLVGENFRFGYRQAGDIGRLAELGRQYGFETEIVPPITLRGQVVSSTAIRRRIQAGQVSMACRMLERPYALEGEVVHGYGIGAKQTAPTLNLATTAEVLPATGVYVTRTHAEDGRSWPSVTNVGYRPTFGGDTLSIEAFLLPALEGPAPARIRMEFLRRLRSERKFPDAAALKTQILRDVARAQKYFRLSGHG